MNLEEMRQRAREGIEPPPKRVKRSTISASGLKLLDLKWLGVSKSQQEMYDRVERLSRDLGRGVVVIPHPRYGKSMAMKAVEIAREMGVATVAAARSMEDMAKAFHMADDTVDAMRLAMDSLNAVKVVKGFDKAHRSPPEPTGPYWPHRIPVPASMAAASNRGRKQRRPVNSFA